jgi:hypothetical protein
MKQYPITYADPANNQLKNVIVDEPTMIQMMEAKKAKTLARVPGCGYIASSYIKKIGEELRTKKITQLGYGYDGSFGNCHTGITGYSVDEYGNRKEWVISAPWTAEETKKFLRREIKRLSERTKETGLRDPRTSKYEEALGMDSLDEIRKHIHF